MYLINRFTANKVICKLPVQIKYNSKFQNGEYILIMGYLLKVHVAYYLRIVKPEKYKAY